MWIIGWIFLSILVGAFASSKKRSGVGWFFLSLIISPLITFIIILVAGSPPGTLKKCPKCAEEVKVEALICRFCNYEFPHELIEIMEQKKGGPSEKITQQTIDELWKQRTQILKKKYG